MGLFDFLSGDPTKKWTRDLFIGFVARTITSNDSALADDDLVFIDTSGGNVTLILMTANGRKRPFRAKNIGNAGNLATLDGASAETIDGQTTYDLVDGDSVQIIPRTTSAWETYK